MTTLQGREVGYIFDALLSLQTSTRSTSVAQSRVARTPTASSTSSATS
jgi:hypothetical protein